MQLDHRFHHSSTAGKVKSIITTQYAYARDARDVSHACHPGQETDLCSRLFLVLVLVLLGLGPLLTLANKTGVATSITQFPVCTLFTLVVRHLALGECDLVADGEGLAALLDLTLVSELADVLDLLGGCVALLGGIGFAWEEDETGLVGLEALDVDLKGLL